MLAKECVVNRRLGGESSKELSAVGSAPSFGIRLRIATSRDKETNGTGLRLCCRPSMVPNRNPRSRITY